MKRSKSIASPGGKLFMLCLVLMLLVPAVRGVFEDKTLRETMERRSLSDRPAAGLLFEQPRTFFSGLDDFLSDRIGFAAHLNRLHRKMFYYAFQTTPHMNISLGGEGMIMNNDKLTELLCQGSDFPEWSNLKYTADYYSRRGHRVIFTVVPSKEVLYPENLAADIPHKVRQGCLSFKDRPNNFFSLRAEAEKEGRIFFYPFEQFYGHRDSTYFYPKENLHWLGTSVRLFCEQLFGELGLNTGPDFLKVVRSKEVNADLVSLFGFQRKTRVNLYDSRAFKVKPGAKQNYYEAMVKDYYGRYNIKVFETENPLSERRALFLTNSFGRNAAITLSIGYRELIHINTNSLLEEERGRFYGEFAGKMAPDDIIILVNDRDAARGRIDRIADALRTYKSNRQRQVLPDG